MFFKRKNSDNLLLGLVRAQNSLCRAKHELENVFKEVDQLKKDAENSINALKVNQGQLDAMKDVMLETIIMHEEKNRAKRLLSNLCFCILGAVIGYLLNVIFH